MDGGRYVRIATTTGEEDQMTDDRRSDDDAVSAFRQWATSIGMTSDDVDDLVQQAREAATSGGQSLADTLAQESAELAVHLGREG
jgi:phage shock protein A